MSDATIHINSKQITATPGEMLIAAAERAGIYIPRFCYHEKLSVAANCRMCLVEVAGAAKPMAACATPIVDGMEVFTESKLASEAQQGTLEFLLINHPLDCPVCDQGGECPLQDQAMAYGDDASRFSERKRAVANIDIGPLIATEMTRCIHCTRCVRFGEEVAGVMELGMPGRGEHAYISAFLDGGVDSEVSGNMIDLCPVGALTSKPYRFAARVWELQSHRGVSPHDCVGANINIQTLRGRVERVLPIENESVNGCWLSDRDRYSYESVNAKTRLQKPMIKRGGGWQEVSWEEAMQLTADGIKRAGAKVAGLAGYISTLEEYYLLQKLVRGLGSDDVDHRLQYGDFSDDGAALLPMSEVPIEEFDNLRAAFLVGSNLRKEQPLLALRLRQAVIKNNARVNIINPIEYQQNFAVANYINAACNMPAALAAVAAAVAGICKIKLPAAISAWASLYRGGQAVQDIAADLIDAGDGGVIILGAGAAHHQDAAAVRAMAAWICAVAKCRLAILPPGNSVAAHWAGCVPHLAPGGKMRSDGGVGLNAYEMLSQPRKAYILLNTDPELDSIHSRVARAAFARADFVVKITAYKNVDEYADVLLPAAAFTETAGHYLNCDMRVQAAGAATLPLGDARPGWKILRVLGNFLDLDGFDYVNLDEINTDKNIPHYVAGEHNMRAGELDIRAPRRNNSNGGLQRLIDMPMYRGDQIVRSAAALQKTADNPPVAVHINSATAQGLGLKEGQRVAVADAVQLPIKIDARVLDNYVYIPAGYAKTAGLDAHARVEIG